MKKAILTVIILAQLGCTANAPPSYTPQTKQLYVLTDLVNGIGELQLAAENAVPANILPLTTARKIVQFCVVANTTIGQAQNGWYNIVNTAYINLKATLTQEEIDNFSYAFQAFEIILNSFNTAGTSR